MVGTHTLYEGAETRRELTCRSSGTITIIDRVEPKDGKEHCFRILFHLPVDKTVTVTNRGANVRSLRTGDTLELAVTSGNISRVYTVTGQETPDYQGWTSPKYGRRDKSICLCFEGKGVLWTSVVQLTFSRP